MVIKKVRQIESFETKTKPKINLSILRKRSTAKTCSGLMLSYAKKFKKSENIEMTIFCQEIYKQMKGIEKSWIVKLGSWKGKSSFEVIKYPETFEVITYQRPDKYSMPKEIKREITREEVNDVLYWIRMLSATSEGPIPTSEIAEKVYRKPWKHVFASRHEHTQLCLILRLLDSFLIIHYRNGFTHYLKKEIKQV